MEHKGTVTIQKISRIAKWGIRALIVIFAILAVILIAVAVVVGLYPELCPENYTVPSVVITSLIAATLVGCVIAVLILLHRLAQNLGKMPTPFVHENVVIMKEVAVVMVVSFIISNAGGAVISFITSTTAFSLDLSPLVTAGIVYFLALIFQYGVELQDESDSFL